MVRIAQEWNGDVLTTTEFDEVENKVVTHRQQDAEPYLDDIARVRQVSDGRGKEYYHAGTIPAVVVEQYCRKRGMSYAEFLRSGFRDMLNDPDYSKLRVWGGRV